MRIPLIYPKIPSPQNCPLKQCIAFEKLDGTNIHWVWKRNYGGMFASFGTRRDQFPLHLKGRQAFAKSHPELADVDEVFTNSPIEGELDYIFTEHENYKDYNEIFVFTEYFGKNSFAGSHSIKDSKKIVLFDISCDGKIITPQNLIKDFSNIELPKVVYKGKYTGQFVEDVRNGKYNVNEGVVVKGIVNGEVYMTKIKTNAYMEKLKNKFEDKWKDYWE